MPRWEIEISDAKGRWGVPPLFGIRGPGVYETSEPLVASEANLEDHVYARKLKDGEKVKVQEDEPGEPAPTSGPLSILDLRPQTVKLKVCEHCGKEYKWSHKRCTKRDKAEAKVARVAKETKKAKPKVKEEPELKAQILPLSGNVAEDETSDE